MAQVSKYPVSEDVYKRCWEIFVKTLIGIRNHNDAQQFITDLLTPIERIMLVKRLGIALLLMQGYEYREIRQVLRVSFPTIAMVNASLKYGSNGYKKAVEKILREENFWEYFNQVAQKLVSAPASGHKGAGAWRYLKQELEKGSKDQNPF